MGCLSQNSSPDLKIYERKIGSKGDINYLRASGNIPGVLYILGSHSKPIYVEKSVLLKIFASYKGRVSSLVIMVTDEQGNTRRAIIKEIQYERVSYDVLHVDMQYLDDERDVKVNIPVFIKGIESCVGVKLGGVLRQVIRHMKVKCLPKYIPSHFEIDVSELQIKKSIRLSIIKLPEGVKPISDVNQVAVLVAKR